MKKFILENWPTISLGLMWLADNVIARLPTKAQNVIHGIGLLLKKKQ